MGLLGAVLLPALAAAQTPEPAATEARADMAGESGLGSLTPGWHLTWENDSLFGPAPSDEFYTQGFQFGYRFEKGRHPLGLGRINAAFCRLVRGCTDSGGAARATSLYVGQLMFTPGNLEEEELIPDDRAYAAWLYLGARFDVLSEHHPEAGSHTLEVQVGTTGKRAQGEWVQANWHKVVPSTPPMGWDNQLPEEYGLQLRYQHHRPLADHVLGEALQVQGTLDFGADAGSMLIGAHAGTTWRLGYNLGDPVEGTLGSKDARRPSAALDAQPRRKCLAGRGLLSIEECYLFAGVVGHGTAFNAFLDGTMFHGGHEVDRIPWTYDFYYGARLRWRAMQLEYRATHSSREFDPVPAMSANRTGKHGFGALNLRCFAPIEHGHRWDLVCPMIFTTLLAAIASESGSD